jgi:hypothetical protein
LTYPGFAGAGGEEGTVDGMSLPYSIVARLIEAEAASSESMGFSVSKGRWIRRETPLTSVGLGIYGHWEGTGGGVTKDWDGVEGSPAGAVNNVFQETTRFVIDDALQDPQEQRGPWWRLGIHKNDCQRFADIVDEIASRTPGVFGDSQADRDVSAFRDALWERFNNRDSPGFNYGEFRSSGFKDEFRDEKGPDNSPNQVYHYVGAFRAGFQSELIGGALMEEHENEYIFVPVYPYRIQLPDSPNHRADKALNQVAVRHGSLIANRRVPISKLGDLIRKEVCSK